MLNLNLAHEADDALIVRVAWLYYVGGLTQEETAARLRASSNTRHPAFVRGP